MGQACSVKAGEEAMRVRRDLETRLLDLYWQLHEMAHAALVIGVDPLQLHCPILPPVIVPSRSAFSPCPTLATVYSRAGQGFSPLLGFT